MSIIVTAEVSKPNEVELTVTVRMTVAAWREVIEATEGESYGHRWHAANFHGIIRSAVREVEHRALNMVAHPDEAKG